MRKPRPHWTENVKAENDALRKQLDNARLTPTLTRFACEVGNNIMLMLANKPYVDWPDLAKTAFTHAQDRQETTAYLYKQRLPK